MAKYPIKMLKDEEGTPFVPLVSTEAVRTLEGETAEEKLGKKLEVSNIVAGKNISLFVDGNNITINNTSSKYSIKDMRSEEAKAILKDWRQEILDTGVIPPITLHVTDSYMLYLTDVFIRGDSVNVAVLRFKGRGDNGEYNGYRVYYETIIFDTTTGEVSSYKNGYSTDEYEVIAYGGMSPNPKKALTTDNTNSYTPTSDYNPATKKYVDDNKYTLPIASTESLGGVKIGENLELLEDGTLNAKGEINLSNALVFTNQYKLQYSKELLSQYFTDCNLNDRSFPAIILNAADSYQGLYYLTNKTETKFTYVTQLSIYERVYYGSSDYATPRITISYTSDADNSITVTDIKLDFVNGHDGRFISTKNTYEYTPTGDYNPATKKYVDDSITTAIAGITQFSLVPVDTLPTENIRTDAIYAIPSDNPQEQDVRIEYVYINDSWEILGTTKIDLSNYYTKEEIDIKLGELRDLINANTTVATSEEVTNILNGIATNGEVTK